MAAARQFKVFPLDDEFRLRKGIVIACMIHVEMRTDEEVDIVGAETKIREVFKYIFFVLGWRHSCGSGIIRREPAIDENVFPITRLNKIASRRSCCWMRSRRDGRSTQLHEIESLWSCVDCGHSSNLS